MRSGGWFADKFLINRRALRLFLTGVEIAERLRGLGVGRRFFQNSEVRIDGILDAVLFEEFLRAFQLLVDVRHSCGLPLRSLGCGCNEKATRLGLRASPLDYIPSQKRGQKLRSA